MERTYKVFVWTNTPKMEKDYNDLDSQTVPTKQVPFIYENVSKINDFGIDLEIHYIGKATGTENVVRFNKQNIINYSTEKELLVKSGIVI